VRVPADDYLAAAADCCRRRGAVLIVDEVQTGFGRTGTLFASTHAGVTPDILLLAKSIAGGLPMGAIVLHERLGAMAPASHGTTFGGGPVVCAAARATLRTLVADRLPERAARLGAALLTRLRAHASPRVREVRGRGLLIGIELKERVQPALVALLERGVLALPAGPNVLRLLPPLVIAEDDLWHVADVLADVLA
jgi:acetylornithine/LysW-gamma-L-lysine aminotransferase